MRRRILTLALAGMMSQPLMLAGANAWAGGCGCEAPPSAPCATVQHFHHHFRHAHCRAAYPPSGILVPSAPMMSAPVMAAPVQMAAMAAPVQMAPVQMAPVQAAPVQMAPVQMAPIQMAPVQMAPVQMAPVQMAPSQCSSSQAAPAAAPSFGCNSGGASGPASAPNQDLAARIVELLENNRRQAAPLGAPSAPGDSLDDRVADLEARVDRLEDAAEKLRSVLTVHNDEIIKLKNK